MKGAIPLGRVLGIRIGIHVTFFLIIAWMAWLGWHYAGGIASLWAIGMILLLFTCVVLHELGHSVVALQFGVEVTSITLLPIGGVAAMRSIPDTPWQELLIAVAGPAVNVVILLVLVPFFGFPEFLEAPLIPQSMGDLIDWLIRANLVLVIFNMVPAFPMDGGRVFRALLAMCFSYTTATAWATGAGRVVAVLFVLLGMRLNPFLALIGIFIFWGAGGEYRNVKVKEALRPYTVADLMRSEFGRIRGIDTMRTCLEAYHQNGHEHFIVEGADGSLRGLLPFSVWMSVLKERGPDEWIGRHMIQRYMTVSPSMALHESIWELSELNQEVFPVLRDRDIIGLLVMKDLREIAMPRESDSYTSEQERETRHRFRSPFKHAIDLG